MLDSSADITVVMSQSLADLRMGSDFIMPNTQCKRFPGVPEARGAEQRHETVRRKSLTRVRSGPEGSTHEPEPATHLRTCSPEWISNDCNDLAGQLGRIITSVENAPEKFIRGQVTPKERADAVSFNTKTSLLPSASSLPRLKNQVSIIPSFHFLLFDCVATNALTHTYNGKYNLMKPAALAGAPHRGKNAIRRLMEFMRLQARLEAGKPTFSKFLGVAASPTENIRDEKNATVREDGFSYLDTSARGEQHQSLVFRYRFPPNDRLRYLDEGEKEDRTTPIGIFRGCYRPSLSTYTSILDDVTTLCIISSAAKHPRPGVSVTMQSQWGPGRYGRNNDDSSPEEVDIVTTITKKGRTLGFVRAEVRDPSNNNGLICHFDHVKYLPTGWLLGIMLTPVGMWCLNLFLKFVRPYFSKGTGIGGKDEYDYANIFDTFQITSDTTARFRFGPQHSNGMGGLHGGVQAILMERLGKTVAQKELLKVHPNISASGILDVQCERLQISYQSSASKVLEIRAHVMDPPRHDHPSITLRIEILRSHESSNGTIGTDGPKRSKRVVVSEGVLTFGSASSKTKDQ